MASPKLPKRTNTLKKFNTPTLPKEPAKPYVLDKGEVKGVIKMTPQPTITFSGYAWAKIKALCEMAPGEVSFYAETDPDDRTSVMDVWVPKQEAGSASYETDGEDEARYIMDAATREDNPLNPENTIKIWGHTHPGNSASPSGTDWDTFHERFSTCEWGVMFILAKQGAISCHTSKILDGEQYAIETTVEVDWTIGYNTAEFKAVLAEKVTKLTYSTGRVSYAKGVYSSGNDYAYGYGGDSYWDRQQTPYSEGFNEARNDVKNNCVCEAQTLVQYAGRIYSLIPHIAQYLRGYIGHMKTLLKSAEFVRIYGSHTSSIPAAEALIDPKNLENGGWGEDVYDKEDETTELAILTDAEMDDVDLSDWDAAMEADHQARVNEDLGLTEVSDV